ncbi:ferredoxin [Candidatus Parcubacteria bacterium]|jgi:ferredoxin|nr:ferredoxin [Candidatus Parcubacteria bacterium]
MKKYKVTVDRNKCISCAVCVSLCPEIFSISADNKIQSKSFEQKGDLLVGEVDESQLLAVQQASQACVENVIKIEKIK